MQIADKPNKEMVLHFIFRKLINKNTTSINADRITGGRVSTKYKTKNNIVRVINIEVVLEIPS